MLGPSTTPVNSVLNDAKIPTQGNSTERSPYEKSRMWPWVQQQLVPLISVILTDQIAICMATLRRPVNPAADQRRLIPRDVTVSVGQWPTPAPPTRTEFLFALTRPTLAAPVVTDPFHNVQYKQRTRHAL